MAGTTPEDNRGALRLASTRYAVLILVAVIFIFPLLFMVMSSLKPPTQLLADTSVLRAFLPVGDISCDNYRDALNARRSGLS
jgi:multiple sugar transport system permease protein